jgi:hypothetical protein
VTAKEKVLEQSPRWSEEQAEAALAAAEGRIVDEWGDLDAQTDAAAAAVMRVLDEQERAESGQTIGEAWGRKS